MRFRLLQPFFFTALWVQAMFDCPEQSSSSPKTTRSRCSGRT